MATIAGQTFTATVSPVGCTYAFSANAPDQNGNTWGLYLPTVVSAA
jgi:hypothetical protein